MSTFKKIFKAGSTTYFYSSLFFPKRLRDDVYALYAFVRTADNFVDAVPQQIKEFEAFAQQYEDAKNKPTGNAIIDSFVALAKRKNFDPQWTHAFLDAMRSDTHTSEYLTLDETCTYMYGSAEVIGLYMSRLMDLSEDAFESAKMLGRSMQYINFIRDIAEDNGLGRQYIPTSELQKYGLKNLSHEEALNNSIKFKECIRSQIETYRAWLAKGKEGFSFIPKRYLIPIKTASEMYEWTSQQIYDDPFIVFSKKVKPTKWRVFRSIVKNTLARQK